VIFLLSVIVSVSLSVFTRKLPAIPSSARQQSAACLLKYGVLCTETLPSDAAVAKINSSDASANLFINSEVF